MIALSVNVLPPLHGGQRVLTARIAPEPDAVFMRCGSNGSPSNEEFARWASAAVEG
ncbi:MAG: hypothetical protein JHC40_06710 [Burkholderiales bacterium]|jgi:hypothetical protein|nr:hypothetical protein [Burkholderiales bacterium]